MRIGIAVIMLVVVSAASANAQSGGSYGVTQSLLGGSGGSSSGGSYSLDGSGGQPLAGGESSGGGYGATSGFWSALPFAPTSAGIVISGRVEDTSGRPIKNLTVMVSGGTLTAPRVVKTNNFGMFTFAGMEVGHTYVVGVVSSRFGFPNQNFVLTPMDSVSDIVFRAGWRN